MKNANIVIGSAVMAVFVVGAHSFIQFIITNAMFYNNVDISLIKKEKNLS